LLVNLSRKTYLYIKYHFMKVMSVGEFKTNFSQALKSVQAGEEIGISYGKNKEIVARLVPKLSIKKTKRKLGILEGKCKVKFGADFKMTEEEFLGV
jgi:antitoxin (DNA-binding transcriptional repressor) of toxin-antitoxin stability system